MAASQELKESGDKVSRALTDLQKGERRQTHLARQLEEQKQKVKKTQEELDTVKTEVDAKRAEHTEDQRFC